ncbi:MAG: copper chaperone PCu(A)C [Pseudomonadota bacterium]
MKAHLLTAAMALGAAASLAQAHDFTAGDLTIQHPMAFETAKTAKAGGGYLTIINNGEKADRLIGAKADFPRVELHTTEETDGVARMMHVDSIDIPPGETVELAPGGFHVMFMGLDGDPFEEGERIPATLVFENAGEVEIEFAIEARDGAKDHGTMDHSNHGAATN